MADRLQARLELFESSPEAIPTTPPRRAAESRTASERGERSADPKLANLNRQLAVLRSQLEEAFKEVERRLAAAEARAEKAEARAAATRAGLREVVPALERLSLSIEHYGGVNSRDTRTVLRDALARIKGSLEASAPEGGPEQDSRFESPLEPWTTDAGTGSTPPT